MLKKTFGMLGIATLGLMQPALAADLPVKAAPIAAPAPFSWTGFYIGGHVGAGWGTVESSITSISIAGAVIPGLGSLPVASHSINGFLGGAQAGYNMQMGNWVVGIEGDISWADVNGTSPCLIGVFSCTTNVNWMADITGRVGVAVDKALIYLKGGAAWVDVDYSASLTLAPALGLNASVSDTRFGALLGVGAEYAVSRNWSAKIEYNYVDFGTETYTFNTTIAGVVPLSATVPIDHQMHLIKGGVNYRF